MAALKEIFGRYRLEIELGGHVRFDRQLSNSRHRHDYFELCLVVEGSGAYEHRDQSLPLFPGSVFLAEPGALHEISSYRSKDLHLYFVSLAIHEVGTGDVSKDDRTVASFLEGHRIHCAGRLELIGYVPLIDAATPFQGALLKLFTLEMLVALSAVPVTPVIGLDLGDVERAMDFVDRNVQRRIKVKEIADHLGVSERTLRRRFHEATGMSLLEEITNRRMRRAAHRLLMGFNAQEVALDVGMTDAAQFSRSFSKVFGISPKRFQSNYLPGTLSRTTRPADEA
jgi:AraC-like DNA-binding protein/mannose-6-phosphate isomerase-like protein (cupin superfamily)